MNFKNKIGFIGGGNMARSLISGLIRQGLAPSQILVSDPGQTARSGLQETFGVTTHADNLAVANAVDLLVLAVKPQVMQPVCEAIGAALKTRCPLIISIAAGIPASAIGNWLGESASQALAIVRCMPNTPAMIGAGASGLFATPSTTPDQRQAAEQLLATAGLVVWVDTEAAIDAVTAISGSGPAYFFLLIEALEKAGITLGLPAETARLLAVETAYGAGAYARQSPDDPTTLRTKVTSPGGTTEAALAVFNNHNFTALVETAAQAAAERAQALAKIAEGDAP